MGKDKLANALGNFESQVMESWRSGWNSYWKLVTDVARNPSSIQQSQKEYLDYISRTAPGDFLKVVEAGTLCYTAIAETGSEMANQFLKRATASADAANTGNGATRTTKPGAPVSEFTFQGYEGDTPGRQFLVTNHSQQPVAIAFAVSGFVSETGDSVSVSVELSPNSFSLAAGEEKVVSCRVTIPMSLAPGVEYRAQLSATGLPALRIRLCVKSFGSQAEAEITVD
jgi:hypothetical protein